MVEFEVDGLDALVADLTRAPHKAQLGATGVVTRGAGNVQRTARATSSGLTHVPAYPASITFDIAGGLSSQIEAEIGPDKDRPQGSLGNLIEFGSVKNAPHNDLGAAFDAEVPRFVDAIEALGEEAIG